MENNQFQLDWLYFEEQLQRSLDLPLPLPFSLPLPEPYLDSFPPNSLIDYSDHIPPLLPPLFNFHCHDNNLILTNDLDHDLLSTTDHLNWFNDLNHHHQIPLLSAESKIIHHQALLPYTNTNSNNNSNNNNNQLMITNNNNLIPINIDNQFCGSHMIVEPDTNIMPMMVDLPHDVHRNMVIASQVSDPLANVGGGIGTVTLKEEDMDHALANVDGASSNKKRENIHGVGKKTKVESLEYEEIAKYFEMPISKAAKKLNVGLTVLKKRCRELEIKRWPHRKLQSLRSLIHNVKELGLPEEVEMLEEHRRMVKKLPQMELTERTKKLRQACFKANYKKRRTIASFF